MKALDYLLSLGNVFAQRVRAALTVLGIVIGTSSIILLASLIEGGEGYLQESSNGITNEDIAEVDSKTPPPKDAEKTTRPLSRADAEAIAAAAPSAMVAPESDRRVYAEHQGKRFRVALVSAGKTTMELYRLRVATGRELDEHDEGKRNCVIGDWVHREVLKSAPLSDSLRISIEGRLYTVVGIMEKKPTMGGNDPWWTWNGKVLIPRTTYDTIYSPSHEVQRIYGRKPNRGTMTSIIFERHLGVANFELAKDESGGMASLIFKVIHVLLLGTGVLALIASGINIMNVMLVTVTERTREIGLRRALGASQKSIMVQFLLEAAVLSTIGAAIGVGVGIALAWAVAHAARAGIGQWGFSVPTWSLALGVGLALLTGIAFGILPAWRASRVSPIDALRSD